jgi:hypothetical protein
MRRKTVFSAMAAMAVAYAAYPYLTLYRLNDALRRGDVASVSSHIDWPRVREALAADVSGEIKGQPAGGETAAQQDDLPAFGSSFVTGMATHAINDRLTPHGLMVAMAEAAPSSATPSHAAARLESAWFVSPTEFLVQLRLGGEKAETPPLRLRMQLVGGVWKVTRAWLPPDLLMKANART